MIATQQPEIPRLPNGRWIILSALFAITVTILLCNVKCSTDPVPLIPTATTKLKETVRKQKIAKDEIRKESDKLQKVREPLVKQYKTVKAKKDSLPCPEALAQVIFITDSILYTDSALINSLRAELFIDSLIIANQDSIIVRDSVQIVDLSKKLKKQKRRTKLVAGVGLVGWLLAAFK